MQTSTTKQIAVSRTAEIQQLTKKAKQFYAQAESMRDQVEAGIRTSLEKAWQCGKCLSAIKAIVGHGNWLTWLTNNWPELSDSTAQLYMKIDRVSPKAQRVGDLEFDTIRKYANSFVPDKSEPNKHRDFPIPRSVSLANVVNEYSRIKYRHQQGLELTDFELVREETAELGDFLNYHRGLRCAHCDALVVAVDPWSSVGHSPR